MANTTNNEEYKTFTEYEAGILIWKVVPPILILVGTIGNILSIVVLTRKSIKTSTTALYLTFLAFSDLLVLHTGLLRQWLRYLIDYDVRHVSQTACKIHIWLVYSSLDFSAWILIAVTLERVISTWCPHTAKTKCSRKYAFVLIITILLLSLCLNSHLLFGMINKIVVDDSGNVLKVDRCATIDSVYGHFFNLTWPWIDLCAFCLIPFSVIVVGNCCILFKVVSSRRKAKSTIRPSIRTNKKTSSTHSSMTAMLFTLNMVFLFTTSPISIYNIGYSHWLEGASDQTNASLEFWWALVNMLMYINNSLNFLLYCLSGSRFRLEVKRLFCPNKENSSNLTPHTRMKFHPQGQRPKHLLNSERNNQPPPNTSTIFQVPNGDQVYSLQSVKSFVPNHDSQTNTTTVTENKPVKAVVERSHEHFQPKYTPTTPTHTARTIDVKSNVQIEMLSNDMDRIKTTSFPLSDLHLKNKNKHDLGETSQSHKSGIEKLEELHNSTSDISNKETKVYLSTISGKLDEKAQMDNVSSV